MAKTKLDGLEKNREVTPAENLSLWHQSSFFRLWVSETISSFGSQFSGLGIFFSAELLLNASAAELGILSAAGTAPFLIFGLLAGVWVDRHRKRRIMVFACMGRSLLLASVPLAFLLGGLTLGLLYLTTFLVGSLQVFYDISYQSYLPLLVERDRLSEGNSKLEASRSTSQVVGPTMAGVAVQALTAPIAIAVDSAGFVMSALSLSGINQREEVRLNFGKPSVWSEIREGLGVVFGDRKLRSIAGCTATSNFFSSSLFPLAFTYLTDPKLGATGQGLGLSASTYGLVFSAGAIGGVVGAVLYRRVASLLGVGWAIIASAFVSGLATVTFFVVTPSFSIPLFSFGGFPLTRAILILIIGSFFTSLGIVIYNVNQVSLRQAIVPLRLQGRMNATMRFLVWGTLPLGAVAGGILDTLLGLRLAILISIIGGTLSFLWVLISPVRRLENIPEPMT